MIASAADPVAYAGQVSNGAFGILWPEASGPQQRVPNSGSVTLVFLSRMPSTPVHHWKRSFIALQQTNIDSLTDHVL
jgi:hypothetical protein